MAGIPKRYIGQIDDSNVQAGAALATSKLADGAKFLKNDGTTAAMTGNLDTGNNKIVNLATPTNGTDAANKSYVDTQISNLNSLFDSKGSARAASTANVNIANPGTATFDGVVLSNGDRLLLKNQTAPAENGIYTFNGSGVALTRVADMDVWAEVPGAFLAIEEGTANADTVWLCTSNQGGTLGTTAINWQQIPTSAGLLNTNFIGNETVSGTVNGANTTFTLANTPVASSEAIYINGYRLIRGTDYTITGATITMTVAPLAGEVITADYRK